MNTYSMKRRFMPVGHGAFYHERFSTGGDEEDVNIVYDCGTKRSMGLLNQQIERAFPVQGERIQAVFLSHMHRDHYSGLKTLLKHYQVDQVYFPDIEAINKLLMGFVYRIEGDLDSFEYKFLINPEEAIRSVDPLGGMPEIVPVKISRLNVDPHDHAVTPSMNLIVNEVLLTQLVGGGAFAQSPFKNWRFITYNIEQPEVLNKLKTRLNEIGINPISNETMTNAWNDPQKKEDILAAYRGAMDNDLNANSVTLFSGIQGDQLNQTWVGNEEHIIFKGEQKVAGCLYTGDYNAKKDEYWKALRTAYDSCWNYIGCVQIPHHGSDRNFRGDLLDPNAFFVISADKNDNKHPGIMVRNEFTSRNKTYHRVTERPASEMGLALNPKIRMGCLASLFSALAKKRN